MEHVSLLSLQLSVLLEIQIQVTTLYGKYLFSLTAKVHEICINPRVLLKENWFNWELA